VFEPAYKGDKCPKAHCKATRPTGVTQRPYFLQMNVAQEIEARILGVYLLVITHLIPRLVPANKEHLQYIKRNAHRQDNLLTDIIDGQRFQRLRNKGWFQMDHDFALILALDGSALFKRNSVQAWPIWGLVANLEPSERYVYCVMQLHCLP
jgi:hypothetical protein